MKCTDRPPPWLFNIAHKVGLESDQLPFLRAE